MIWFTLGGAFFLMVAAFLCGMPPESAPSWASYGAVLGMSIGLDRRFEEKR